jgi:cytochrome c biogenesis protein
LIAVYSIIGTVLPQGLATEFYIENYPKIGSLIGSLQFDQVYSSWIFRILLAFFMINLIGCTINILPAQLKRMQKTYFMKPKLDSQNLYEEGTDVEKFKEVLKKQKYYIEENENGFKASKHKIGNVGSSVTHLGIIIIVLGSFLGNIFAEEGFFNMLPGDIKGFPDYGFSVQLDEFRLGFRDNKTVDQYYSDITILRPAQEPQKETLWVNKPLKINDLNFYQTSYGWGNDLLITDAQGSELGKKLLRNGESFFYEPERLTIQLYGFYPDFILTNSGEPLSMSEKKDNPFYAVILYEMDKNIGSYVVEPGEVIKYNDINIAFEDSTLYTGITYRKDFGYFFVVLGSFLLVLGLIFSFYFYSKHVIVEQNSIKTATRQNSWGYDYVIKRLVDKSRAKGEK